MKKKFTKEQKKDFLDTIEYRIEQINDLFSSARACPLCRKYNLGDGGACKKCPANKEWRGSTYCEHFKIKRGKLRDVLIDMRKSVMYPKKGER